MRQAVVIFFAILFSQITKAQSGGMVVPGGGVAVTDYKKPPMFLREVFSEAVAPKPHMDINGSPFIFENFLLATIKLSDKRVMDSVHVKLNAYDNKVHFLDDKGEEMQVAVVVDEVIITDKSNPSWDAAVFRSGYTGGGSFFYRVLTDGKKIQLLKKIMLNIWETRALGEQNKRNFQYEDQLCFAVNGTVYFESKKCGSVIAALTEKYQEQVKKFVADNNIKCNKEEDMKKLVEYYNSL